MKTVLTIAGFDPSNGAGVTADLAVMAAYGMFGTSCVTALTVQSTLGVKDTHAVEAEVVTETLEWLTQDLRPAGIKIGMLANEGIVAAVIRFLEGLAKDGGAQDLPVVLDPVIRSSSGKPLLDAAGLNMVRRSLLPMVDWVTPNGAELGALAGLTVGGAGDVERAAKALRDRLPGLNVVGTGGDQARPDDMVVMADGRVERLRGERIASQATHGTGCAFSTALLCGLVDGMDGMMAAKRAKQFVSEGILRAEKRGGGKGPLDLYWPMRAAARERSPKES